MKVMAFNGSPRKKKWNTITLLKNALKGAASVGAETELIQLYDLNFSGCISCFSCKRISRKKDGGANGWTNALSIFRSRNFWRKSQLRWKAQKWRNVWPLPGSCSRRSGNRDNPQHPTVNQKNPQEPTHVLRWDDRRIKSAAYQYEGRVHNDSEDIPRVA